MDERRLEEKQTSKTLTMTAVNNLAMNDQRRPDRVQQCATLNSTKTGRRLGRLFEMFRVVSIVSRVQLMNINQLNL